MSIAYWIVASLLAATYLYGGVLKVLRTPDQLRPMMAWVDRIPLRLVRTIGILEVLGALGLILPPLTGIAPGLCVVAAFGLVLLQCGGIVVHLTSTDDRQIILNLVLLALAAAAVVLALSSWWETSDLGSSSSAGPATFVRPGAISSVG